MENEDEDLELLRLAALKTMKPNNKAEVVDAPPPKPYTPQTNAQPQQQAVYSRHPINQPMPQAFAPAMPQIIHHDPYGPPSGVPVNPYWNDSMSYYPAERPPPIINHPAGPPPMAKPHVQLSPRSAAFVMENNSILEQRKKSPRNYNRSPNYRASPGRWSESPPPYKHRYAPRRSMSRSPSPNRHRSVSRSPPPTRSRYNSRSPPPKRVVGRKSRSRSPLRHHPSRRSPSPGAKPLKSNRSFSPSRKKSPPRNRPYQSYNGKYDSKSRRSQSPKRKSRSPINRGANSRNNNTRYRNGGKYNGSSSRPESPARKKIRSKSKSPMNNNKPDDKAKVEERKIVETEDENKHDNSAKDILQLLNDESDIKLLDEDDFDFGLDVSTKEFDEKKTEIEESSTPPIPVPKTEEELEDELLASENENTEDELELADEIDLFASEESESENEGRFKSSTQRKSDKAATVPFSKLGQSSLNTRNRSPSKERERRRDRRSDSRSERRRDYGSSSSSSRSKISLSSKVESKSDAGKRDDGKTLFKSTFRAVDGDGKKISDSSPKSEPAVQKETERKSVSLKRSVITTISKNDPVLKSTITFENTSSTSNSSSSQGTSSSSSVKKAIHLRLGPSKSPSSSSSSASTTTSNVAPPSALASWKKKTWRQEKV